MKLFYNLTLAILLGTASSCAMIFNEKTVDVAIGSNPPGADIFIEGRNYGKTPATIKIEPKKYNVILTKEGYGSTRLDLDYWVTLRNGNCVADVIGAMLIIPYYSFYWSGYCNDFKQKENFVTIPHNLSAASGSSGASMMGTGNNPSNMINYYYNQDLSGNAAQQSNGKTERYQR
jgi:hypothetical protein